MGTVIAHWNCSTTVYIDSWLPWQPQCFFQLQITINYIFNIHYLFQIPTNLKKWMTLEWSFKKILPLQHSCGHQKHGHIPQKGFLHSSNAVWISSAKVKLLQSTDQYKKMFFVHLKIMRHPKRVVSDIKKIVVSKTWIREWFNTMTTNAGHFLAYRRKCSDQLWRMSLVKPEVKTDWDTTHWMTKKALGTRTGCITLSTKRKRRQKRVSCRVILVVHFYCLISIKNCFTDYKSKALFRLLVLLA